MATYDNAQLIRMCGPRDPYTIPPGKRCLIPSAPGSQVWRMPDDYPDCVADALIKAYPYLERAPK